MPPLRRSRRGVIPSPSPGDEFDVVEFMRGMAGMIQRATQANQTQGGSSSAGMAVPDGSVRLEKIFEAASACIQGRDARREEFEQLVQVVCRCLFVRVGLLICLGMPLT